MTKAVSVYISNAISGPTYLFELGKLKHVTDVKPLYGSME